MVASRKPRKPVSRRRRETLEDTFRRVVAEPVDAPVQLTKREARYFARRLWETGDPSEPSGDEVMRAFFGECECDVCSGETPDSR